MIKLQGLGLITYHLFLSNRPLWTSPLLIHQASHEFQLGLPLSADNADAKIFYLFNSNRRNVTYSVTVTMPQSGLC